MRGVFICALVFFLLSPAMAFATSPCIPQTPAEFTVMKEAADLIVHVKITDYQVHNDNLHAERSWTDVEVLKVYKGETAEKALRLHGWASYYMPLYVHDKGAEAVLMLKKTDSGYELADLSWKKCVPAVIGLPAEFPVKWNGKTYTRDAFIDARLNPEPPSE